MTTETAPPACPPHWYILPEADGPTSLGVCKHCGEERLHSNSFGYNVGYANSNPNWLKQGKSKDLAPQEGTE